MRDFWCEDTNLQEHSCNPEADNVVYKPDISFSRSNMALVASSCSQLTWLLWQWESSTLGKVPWSFPLPLFAPLDSLKVTFSGLLDRGWKWCHDGPSVLSPSTPPFWLQWGTASESGGSSSSAFFVETSDSWDLDRLSPLKIILMWEVRVLSKSSFLSWVLFSPADPGSCSVSALSGASAGVSCWEMTMVGIVEAPGFSEGTAEDSAFRDGDMASFGASVSGLALCKEKQHNQVVTADPEALPYLIIQSDRHD